MKRARNAHEVRQLLTDTKVTTSHRLFRFVGMEAYAAAGGTITRDLFAAEGEGYANDSELVQRIAGERFRLARRRSRGRGLGLGRSDRRGAGSP